jgi:HPr kinase/phosphorylase
MRPATALAGLIELRGLGIVRLPFEPVAVAHLVVDLAAPDAARIPDPAARSVEIAEVRLARLPVAPGGDAFSQLLGFLQFSEAL